MSLVNNKSQFFVPKGREVFLKFSDNTNVFNSLANPNIHMLLEDDISLSINSEYSSLLEASSSSFMSLLGNSFSGFSFSGQFALQGFQLWKSTDILKLNIDVQFNMVTSAKNDVLIPSLHLAALTVPSKQKTNPNDKGIGNALKFSLIPPGPNLAEILSQVGLSEKTQDVISTTLGLSAARGVFNLQVGEYLHINDIIITKAEPTYSAAVDENYIPISCKLSLSCETVEVVTSEMLQGIIDKISP